MQRLNYRGEHVPVFPTRWWMVLSLGNIRTKGNDRPPRHPLIPPHEVHQLHHMRTLYRIQHMQNTWLGMFSPPAMSLFATIWPKCGCHSVMHFFQSHFFAPSMHLFCSNIFVAELFRNQKPSQCILTSMHPFNNSCKKVVPTIHSDDSNDGCVSVIASFRIVLEFALCVSLVDVVPPSKHEGLCR